MIAKKLPAEKPTADYSLMVKGTNRRGGRSHSCTISAGPDFGSRLYLGRINPKLPALDVNAFPAESQDRRAP